MQYQFIKKHYDILFNLLFNKNEILIVLNQEITDGLCMCLLVE